MLASPVSPATVSLNPASSSAPVNFGLLPSPRQSQFAVSVALLSNMTRSKLIVSLVVICTAKFPEKTTGVFAVGSAPATVSPSSSVTVQFAGFETAPSPPAFVQRAFAYGTPRNVPLPAFDLNTSRTVSYTPRAPSETRFAGTRLTAGVPSDLVMASE